MNGSNPRPDRKKRSRDHYMEIVVDPPDTETVVKGESVTRD